MAKIDQLTWKLQITVSRDSVKAMEVLGRFLGNIQAEVGQKSDFDGVDWNDIRCVFHEFRRLQKIDDEFTKHLREFVIYQR